METRKYNIKAVGNLTGLTEHTIRAWERRYSAVVPERTETNRRQYSEEDITKLKLLRQAVSAGHSISGIAALSIAQLKDLVGKHSVTGENNEYEQAGSHSSFEELISEAIERIKKFDRKGFEKMLIESSVEMTRPQLLIEFVIPLLEKIGTMWETGDMRVANEHFAAGILRTYLGNLLESHNVPSDAPVIVTTTPSGFLHELGALISAVFAMEFGWNAVYLGPNLPAEEIAMAAKKNNAICVLLSLVYPADDPHAGSEIRKLRSYIGDETNLLVSGYSAPAYEKFLTEINGILILRLEDLRDKLKAIRI